MFRVADGAAEEFRTCLVCSDKITAMHLGMDTCRACSSFFKRTKTLDRHYPCRQGDRNCVVTKEGKFTCRRCRYDKCLAVGMQYDGLMRVRAKRPESLLEKVEAEYRVFMNRRKILEIGLIESSDVEVTRVPHHREKLYQIKDDVLMTDLFAMTVREAYEFFLRIFPSTSVKADQELIFKDSVGKFFMIDHYFRTMLVFGEIRQYIFSSAVTVFDAGTFLDSETGDSLDDTMMKSSARTYADEEKSVFLPIFMKAKITEKEFFASVALLMSEIEDPSLLSTEGSQLLDDLRKSIFRELQDYYRNDLGIVDYSVRLGNLMSLNHAMQESKSLFQVFFRFYATIFEEQILIDEKMKNLFL